MIEETLTADELKEKLKQFRGTYYYYTHQLGAAKIMLTDGTKFLAEQAQAYWLFDTISSYQYKLKVNSQKFQLWKLEKLTTEEWLLSCTDGNDTLIEKQVIAFSDFPLDRIKIYLVDGVAMLPGEY